MARDRRPAPSLEAAVWGFALLTTVSVSIAIVLLVGERARRFDQRVQAQALEVRTASLALGLRLALEREWHGLVALGEALPGAGPETAGALFAAAVRGDGIVSWAVFARTDGVVATASSGGVAAGIDVSARPWFQRGLNGDHAGDRREAAPPAASGNAPGPDRLRGIDLARPVTDAGGRTLGVVAVHIDAGSLRDHLHALAEGLGLEVHVLARDGTVNFRVGRPVEAPLSPRAVQLAASATPGTFPARPGEDPVLTAVLTDLGRSEVPSLGWRLVARLPDQAIASDLRALRWQVSGLVGALVFAIATFTLLFVRIFVRPFRALADNAAAISRGAAIYPYESGSSREIAELSAILARRPPPD